MITNSFLQFACQVDSVTLNTAIAGDRVATKNANFVVFLQEQEQGQYQDQQQEQEQELELEQK